MRSSIELRLAASSSHSSCVPRSGMRWSSPLRMMAWLVALIASMCPTVRRVTVTLATAARVAIRAAQKARAPFIFRTKASNSPMS